MICITGTPGTGKTAIMNDLMKKGYEAKEFDEISEECVSGMEGEERMVDEDCIGRLRQEGIYFGHLSHFAKCDLVIVIRAHLRDVYSRLEKRGYSKEKIMENVECESIDLIGSEAAAIHPGRTCEILNENLPETVAKLENILKRNVFPQENIELVEEILNWY